VVQGARQGRGRARRDELRGGLPYEGDIAPERVAYLAG
jgi:hypothetical protein